MANNAAFVRCRVINYKHNKLKPNSEADRRQVRSWSATSFEPASVMEFGSRVSLMMYVARVESRRRHHGVGGSLCGAQPTPVWPCKQPSTVRCPQTASVRISIRQCIALTDAFDRNRNP